VGRRLVRQARQRRAADLAPVVVHLRDGSSVRLRPVLPDDAAAVLEHPERSSLESRYRRFFRPAPSERDLRRLADADYDDHFGWVALDDREVPVGEASYFRLPPDGTDAEISFWLADDVQGHGLGGLMLGALAVAAGEHGVTRFSSDVLADNVVMRAILDRAGVRWMPEECGVVRGTGPVPDPNVFGIDQRTARALRSLVREVWLRPERAAAG
jgi:RimJ/RimL family protein N-acetyltransferase